LVEEMEIHHTKLGIQNSGGFTPHWNYLTWYDHNQNKGIIHSFGINRAPYL